MPSVATPTQPAAAAFTDLAPGEAAEIACGDTGPIFSPSGELVACGRELFVWPTMERLADLQGRPLGWGQLGGTESLLIEVSRDAFATLDAASTRGTVDTAGLEGRIIAEWGPGGDAVWLQSGIQTATLRLDSWTPAGREQLASAADTITATNITASPDGRWAATFSRGCSTSGCAFSIELIDTATSAATAVAANMPGTLAEAWVTGSGEVLFALSGERGQFDLWRAKQGESPSIWLPGVGRWPLEGNRLAFAGMDDALVIDLATGDEEPLDLPSEIQPSDLLAISPDSAWIAVRTEESSVVFMPRLEGGGRRIEVPVPSPVTVHWTGNPDYAVFAFGPPFTTVVVRLAD
jgi:hypothetical protein